MAEKTQSLPLEPIRNPEEVQDLFESNSRLLNFCRLKFGNFYYGTCYSEDDLDQIGAIGLIKAAQLWDPELSQFSTYAVSCITRNWQREYPFYQPSVILIKYPASSLLGYYRTLLKKNEFKGRHVSERWYQKTLKLTRKQYFKLRKSYIASCPTQKLPKSLPYKDEAIEVLEDNEQCQLLLNRLNPREKDIISHRFGINCKELTLKQLGKKYKLTRERIRQIELVALNKMRKSVGIKDIKVASACKFRKKIKKVYPAEYEIGVEEKRKKKNETELAHQQ